MVVPISRHIIKLQLWFGPVALLSPYYNRLHFDMSLSCCTNVIETSHFTLPHGQLGVVRICNIRTLILFLDVSHSTHQPCQEICIPNKNMYFPTASARKLATIPGLPNIPPEQVVAIALSPRKLLFCTLSRTTIAVWSGRVSAAHFAKLKTHIL